MRVATLKVESEATSFLRSLIVRDRADITVLAIWKRLEATYPTVTNIARDILIVLGMS